jgi:hypothetical protein
LQRNDTLSGKGKTLGKDAAFPSPDRACHGIGNIGFVGQLVEELHYIPISTGKTQCHVTVFVRENFLAHIVFPRKNLDAFKVQGVIHSLDNQGFLIWIKNPDIGQQIDMAQCNILDVKPHKINFWRYCIDCAAGRDKNSKEKCGQKKETIDPVGRVAHGKITIGEITG